MIFAPVSIHAEGVVIGSLLAHSGFMDNLDLDLGDFYDERNRVIYRAMLGFKRNRDTFNTALVVGELEKHDNVVEAGGVTHIRGLEGMAVHQEDQFESAVKKVKNTSLCRRYYDFARRVLNHTDDIDDPTKLSAVILDELRAVNNLLRSDSTLMWDDTFSFQYGEIEKRFEEHADGTYVPVDFPWEAWNKIIRPLRPGMIALIAGLSGLGKTLLAENLADHWAQGGFKVNFYHAELDHSFMMDRRDSRLSGIPLDKIEDAQLDSDDLAKLLAVHGELSKWRGKVHYHHTPGWSAQEIANHVRRMVDMGECDIFIVDYLQKIPLRPMGGMTSAQVVGYDFELLKNAAEVMPNTIGVVLSQYNNSAKRIKNIYELKDDALRNGSEPHDKSNLAIFMHGEKVEEPLYSPDGTLLAGPGQFSPIVQSLIDKQTRGPQGVGDLYFDRPKGLITDLDWSQG